jgi:hypothetical protein
MIVEEIKSHVLKCKIISEDEKIAGKIVLIPCITLEPSSESLTIPLRRKQVRLAFCMTINKSQG